MTCPHQSQVKVKVVVVVLLLMSYFELYSTAQDKLNKY
jgi:hypothetical protein